MTNRPTVLILASDAAFSRELTAHWPQDSSHFPDFVVLDRNPERDLQNSHYDLAIVDASQNVSATRSKLDAKNWKQSLAATLRPAILVHDDAALGLYRQHGAVVELHRVPGVWSSLAALVGQEILLRRQAESRARDAESLCSLAQADATLGRYMVEMRTNVNNALTTVLGNAELLTLEPGLPASVQAQADTIRNMALRLHEVFQRFSSIEKELSADARESHKKAATAVAGR